MANKRALTLMAVHAHPDDEASSTGGILARYGAEGIETVLVTCTNGELGDAAGGIKPGEPGHDESEVVAVRRAELDKSASILKISHVELLGYHDSGMMGWSQNSAPGAFWGMDVATAARPLVALMERYRPDVVVTYDAHGFYGHPDHIQAHRITMHAVATTNIAKKVYFPAFPHSVLPRFAEAMREAGLEVPEPVHDAEEAEPVRDAEEAEPVRDAEEAEPVRDAEEAESEQPEFGVPDEEIAATIDCRDVIAQKFDALAAHASQVDDSFFLKMGRERFAELFGIEHFVREIDLAGSAVPERDLFAGLR